MLYINPVVGMENGCGEFCLIFKLTILDCFPIANPVKSLTSISQNISVKITFKIMNIITIMQSNIQISLCNIQFHQTESMK